MDYYPEYIGRLQEMIAICDFPGYNDIGDARGSLSVSWYNNATPDQLHRIRCNMRNFVRDRCHAKTADAFYTCFKKSHDQLKQYGIGQFVPCNMRASNDYRSCTVLCYPVNIFCNPMKKRYLSSGSASFNEDLYALSILIQWIWRSAIRDGKPIKLYIPSRRMRSLLIDWIDRTMQDYAVHLEAALISDEASVPTDSPASSDS